MSCNDILAILILFLLLSKEVMHTKNEQKTLWVVIITAIAMVSEIFFGLRSQSTALFADGVHMGSHVLAIGLSWIAYVIVRKVKRNNKFNGNPEKILTLSGYTSALLLLLFSIFILSEAVAKFLTPIEIVFQEAIWVALGGFVVNIISAALLHHSAENDDHNIKAAYLHVIADAATSIAAIIGIIAAYYYKMFWVDPLCAVLSSFLILKWSISLLKKSAMDLIKS